MRRVGDVRARGGGWNGQYRTGESWGASARKMRLFGREAGFGKAWAESGSEGAVKITSNMGESVGRGGFEKRPRSLD